MVALGCAAFAILPLLGTLPDEFTEYETVHADIDTADYIAHRGRCEVEAEPVIHAVRAAQVLEAIVLLKGKVWTGLVGMFITPLLFVGAIRLSRPHAPWARWRYTSRPRKMHRALERERWLRRPVVQPVPDGVPDGYRLRNLAATWPLPVPCTQAVRREGPGSAAVRAGAH